jgi:hypothetical protein
VTASNLGTQGPLYGNAVLPSLGTRPAFNPSKPSYNRSVACLTQTAPNLNHVKTSTAP